MARIGYEGDFDSMDRDLAGTLPEPERVPGLAVGHPRRRSFDRRPSHGTILDLGATAKAWAADLAAAAIHGRLGCGTLVSLGGDIAVAGPAPAGGSRWVLPTSAAIRRRRQGGYRLGRSGHLRDRKAPLDPGRSTGPPPARPGHRPSGRLTLAHRVGDSRIVRRCQHGVDRSHDRSARPQPDGWRSAGFPPAWFVGRAT